MVYCTMVMRNTGKLAPKGWHVPTDKDWQQLRDYLIANGFNYDGTFEGNKVAKSLAADTDWLFADELGEVGHLIEKNNAAHFNALPSGFRLNPYFFDGLGSRAYYWSATRSPDSNFRRNFWLLNHREEAFIGPEQVDENWALAIRCVKD